MVDVRGNSAELTEYIFPSVILLGTFGINNTSLSIVGERKGNEILKLCCSQKNIKYVPTTHTAINPIERYISLPKPLCGSHISDSKVNYSPIAENLHLDQRTELPRTILSRGTTESGLPSQHDTHRRQSQRTSCSMLLAKKERLSAAKGLQKERRN